MWKIIGVIAAAAVVALGAILYLAADGLTRPDYHTFHAQPPGLYGGRAVIQAGVLLLIATPVARVALSIVAFAAERDRMYVGFATIVLVILLYSLFGSP